MRANTRPGRSRKEWLRDEASAWLATPQSVYVIGSEGGLVKVGIARDVGHRLAALQQDRPDRLTVLYQSEPSAFAKEIEQLCHEMLMPHHSAGEWFTTAPAAAIQAVKASVTAIGRRNRRLPPKLPSYRSGPTV